MVKSRLNRQGADLRLTDLRLNVDSLVKVAVLSPHLDDGVLSLGGSIAHLTRRGVNVDIITVLAGDPSADLPAGRYDESCGFATAGEAVRTRRAEDATACRLVGANPTWMPFWDGYYSSEGVTEDEVIAAIEAAVVEMDLVLIPGYPLLHPDHAWLSTLVLAHLSATVPVGLYREQPYAMSEYFGIRMRVNSPLQGIRAGFRARAQKTLRHTAPGQLQGLTSRIAPWSMLSLSFNDWLAKQRAIGAYRTQLPKLGQLLRPRLSVYEGAWGGEAVALPRPRPRI